MTTAQTGSREIRLPKTPRYLAPFHAKLHPHFFADVLVLGGGLAGLTAALSVDPSLTVLVVCKAGLTNSNSVKAQGGIATAVLGAVIATLGLITPSVIIILIIASFLGSFRDNPLVERTFYGLRPASAGMIASAGLGVAVTNLFFSGMGWTLAAVNWKGWVLAVVLWVLTNKVKATKSLHPIVFIAASAIIGIIFKM